MNCFGTLIGDWFCVDSFLLLVLTNFQPMFPAIWRFLCPWAYAEFGCLTWLTDWLTELRWYFFNTLGNSMSSLGGVRTWNFQGYWRNTIWKFQRSSKKEATSSPEHLFGIRGRGKNCSGDEIEKEVEFPGVIKKKSFGIFMGLGFWPWNFQDV